VSARKLKNYANSNYTCLSSIPSSSTSSLQAGDIIASDGHVVMVDQVGDDPWGLRRAATASDCNEQILSSDGFDFIITHSTPWKKGLGINRSIARDYLKTYETFKSGLTKYAVAFCNARFHAKVPKPSIEEVNIVRHLGTTECLAPNPIGLRYEACIQNCALDEDIPTI
jgi:hypothetical protein